MFALDASGRDCASGQCPTGLATMNPKRYRVVDSLSSKKSYNFRQYCPSGCRDVRGIGLCGPHELTAATLLDDYLKVKFISRPKLSQGSDYAL